MKQKFNTGDLVHLVKNTNHEKKGTLALVLASWEDENGEGVINRAEDEEIDHNYSLMLLPNFDSCAWFDEDELELVMTKEQVVKKLTPTLAIKAKMKLKTKAKLSR